MSESMTRDEETLARLRGALRRRGDDSPDIVDMVMTGYDLTMENGPIAAISEDTAVSGLAPTRAGGAVEPRFITCEANGVVFEFEIDGERIIGTIDPARSGRVVLQQDEVREEATIGRSGSYELTLSGSAPFRLVLESDDGTSVSTEWVLP
jgi:hypothetical protein